MFLVDAPSVEPKARPYGKPSAHASPSTTLASPQVSTKVPSTSSSVQAASSPFSPGSPLSPFSPGSPFWPSAPSLPSRTTSSEPSGQRIAAVPSPRSTMVQKPTATPSASSLPQPGRAKRESATTGVAQRALRCIDNISVRIGSLPTSPKECRNLPRRPNRTKRLSPTALRKSPDGSPPGLRRDGTRSAQRHASPPLLPQT